MPATAIISLRLFTPSLKMEWKADSNGNEVQRMNARLIKILCRLTRDVRGQDLVEYALVAGFVAVAGGALFPTSIAPNISMIFSKINSSFAVAATLGS